MNTKKTALLLILCGIAIRVILLVMAEGTMIDDAYITLRSAENLLEGHGLTYNKAARVLAVSGPLYGYWVALLVLITRGIRAGYVIGATNIAIFAITAWWLWKVCSEISRKSALLVLVVFVSFLRFVDNSTTGMETPLFLLAIVGSLMLLEKRRYLWLSLCVALSMLLRPEGALLAPAVIIVLAIRRARLGWVDLVPGAAVLAAWTVFSYSCYGSPIPNSLMAKSAWFYSVEEAGLFRNVATAFFSLSLFDNRLAAADIGMFDYLMTAAGLLSIIPFAHGARWFFKERSVLAVLPLLFLLYLGFYVIGKGSTVFSWYGIPSGLGYLVTVVFGSVHLLRSARRVARIDVYFKVLVIVLTLVLATSSITIWKGHRLRYYRNLQESYGRAGEFVNQVAGPDDRLFTAEIGIIGYKARRFVYDMGGIASPEILDLYDGRPRSEVMLGILMRFKPEFIVLDYGNLEDLMSSSDPEWVSSRYQKVAAFSNHAVLACLATDNARTQDR